MHAYTPPRPGTTLPLRYTTPATSTSRSATIYLSIYIYLYL